MLRPSSTTGVAPNSMPGCELAKMIQKLLQNLENIDKITHHVATWRTRAPNVHPRASKGASKEASDHYQLWLRGPPGAPSRARGILDKSNN